MNLHQRTIDLHGVPLAAPPALSEMAAFALGSITVEPARRRLIGAEGQTVSVAPLVMQVLATLAVAEGEPVSRDTLAHECWGRRIVGDDAINRAVSLLRRKLAEAGGGAIQVETIAKVGYRLAIGEAERAQPAIPAAAVAAPARKRRTAMAAGSLLLAAAFAAGAWWPGAQGAAPIAIAIEPVPAQTDQAAARHFTGDVSADVARLAEAMTGVAVVDPGARGAAADMKVRISVLHEGRQMSARAQLVEGRGGTVVWSHTYTNAKGSPAELRTETAIGIASILRCGLERSTGDLSGPVDSRLYFAACDAVDRGDWVAAQTFGQRIVDRDPSAAAGWACLAVATAFGAASQSAPDDAVLRKAETQARRALELNERSPLAYRALVTVHSLQGRPVLGLLEKGIALNPEDGGLQIRYASALSDAGYIREALAPAQRALALEPTKRLYAVSAVWRFANAGQMARALRQQAELERAWPGAPEVTRNRFYLLPLTRDPLAAAEEAKALPQFADPDFALIREHLEWRRNPAGYDFAAFDREAERLFAERPASAWTNALTAARMGAHGRARSWLQRAPAEYGQNRWTLLFGPDGRNLRQDPLFFEKMAQLGLLAQWRARKKWPDFCQDPQLGYSCEAEARKHHRGREVPKA